MQTREICILIFVLCKCFKNGKSSHITTNEMAPGGCYTATAKSYHPNGYNCGDYGGDL